MISENEAILKIKETHQIILTKYGEERAIDYLSSLKKVVQTKDFKGIELLSEHALEMNEDHKFGKHIREEHQSIPRCLYPMDRQTEMLIEQSNYIYS